MFWFDCKTHQQEIFIKWSACQEVLYNNPIWFYRRFGPWACLEGKAPFTLSEGLWPLSSVPLSLSKCRRTSHLTLWVYWSPKRWCYFCIWILLPSQIFTWSLYALWRMKPWLYKKKRHHDLHRNNTSLLRHSSNLRIIESSNSQIVKLSN